MAVPDFEAFSGALVYSVSRKKLQLLMANHWLK
jgi:hypothetical protein